MYKVILTGFASKKDAKVFADWFCDQGEQDAFTWFEVENCPLYTTKSIKKDNDGNVEITVAST